MVRQGMPLLMVLAACPKSAPPAPPPVGWHAEEGWAGACYFPKDYDAMGVGDRKLARAEALREMMTQWTGGRSDGVEFSATLSENVETALLGKPEHVEEVSRRNAALCKEFRTSGNKGA